MFRREVRDIPFFREVGLFGGVQGSLEQCGVGDGGCLCALGTDGDLSLTFATSLPMFPSEIFCLEKLPVFLNLDGLDWGEDGLFLEVIWGESPGGVML